MKLTERRRGGQALVMVTLALFAMMGIIGLAVDLGWSFYVKKSAQAAVDSAAIAAAQRALDRVGQAGIIACGPNAQCTAAGSPYTCPEGAIPINNNLDSGCIYAQRNGFSTGGRDNSQRVTLDANIPENRLPPTVLGTVSVEYWVTARAVEAIPQLFSSLLGHNLGTSAARATAAIVESVVIGSLILLNREGDWAGIRPGGGPIYGVNLQGQASAGGSFPIRALGGILMASQCHGDCTDGTYAGDLGGGTMVSAPFTYIRGLGDVSLSNNASWIADPQSGWPESDYFLDPMRGKGQPPPPVGLPPQPVLGGVIDGTTTPAVLSPGNYYATALRDGNEYATGDPIKIQGQVTFKADSDGFGDWVFFGGVSIATSGKGATNVTFDPGRYIFAGVRPTKTGTANPLFDASASGDITLQSSGSGSDYAGSMFIFTDPNYRGGPGPTELDTTRLTIPPLVQPIAGQLKQGSSGFHSGNSPQLRINLNGLNENSSLLPEELEPFSSVLIWQDQRNSSVAYDYSGNIACGNETASCPNEDMEADGVVDGSPNFFFRASPRTVLNGTIYQPRGAWTTMVGGGDYSGPLKIITGALDIQAESAVTLLPTQNNLRRKIVALIE